MEKRREWLLAQMVELAEKQCQRNSMGRALIKELKASGLQCRFIAIAETLQESVSEEQLFLSEMAKIGSTIDPISAAPLFTKVEDENFRTEMARLGMSDPDCV